LFAFLVVGHGRPRLLWFAMTAKSSISIKFALFDYLQHMFSLLCCPQPGATLTDSHAVCHQGPDKAPAAERQFCPNPNSGRLVEQAVRCEPVSTAESLHCRIPANREKNREFYKTRPPKRFWRAITRGISIA